jgi:hypothetical protein
MNITTTILLVILLGLGATYALWFSFLAVMGLQRAKDAGLLNRTGEVLAVPILIFGYGLDVAVNWTVMTLVLLELPREATVTARLQRHNRRSTGWRKSVALWAAPLLDPFDPSGKHL